MPPASIAPACLARVPETAALFRHGTAAGRPGPPAGRGWTSGRPSRPPARGATLANVARAAGSRAKRPADLRAIGGRIMKRLRDSGQIEDAFAEAGYTIADWCRGVIEQTQATKTLRVCYRGRVVDEIEVPDWPARTAARQQYAEAVGLFRLSPPDPEDCAASPLSELSDETLCRLMEWVEQVEKDPAAAPPAAAAGLP